MTSWLRVLVGISIGVTRDRGMGYCYRTYFLCFATLSSTLETDNPPKIRIITDAYWEEREQCPLSSPTSPRFTLTRCNHVTISLSVVFFFSSTVIIRWLRLIDRKPESFKLGQIRIRGRAKVRSGWSDQRLEWACSPYGSTIQDKRNATKSY